MNQETLQHLNSFLKGEEMAVMSYDRFIKDVNHDEKAKNELQDIQRDHKRHTEILRQRIRELGGNPIDGTGFAGVMASAKGVLESAGGRNTMNVLKEAYDGEDKGIAAGEKFAKAGLDEQSKVMVDQILSQDHDHLKRMASLIGSYENME